MKIKPAKKGLIIAPVGNKISAHKEWLKGKRAFDLMLVNYSDILGLYRKDADYYFEVKGFKLEILKQAIEANQNVVRKYDAVWLPDDDHSISGKNIERLFNIFYEQDLDLAQPAVKWGYTIYPVLKRKIGYKLRFVNFIEMMCPIFKTEILFHVLSLFNLNRSGWGIDFLWSKRLAGKRLAVIDEGSIVHARPYSMEGNYYKKLMSLGIDPNDECERMMRRYKLIKDVVVYDSILKSWADVLNRCGLFKYLQAISEWSKDARLIVSRKFPKLYKAIKCKVFKHGKYNYSV